MTLDDVLRELIGCLGARDDCVIGWEQIRRWPKGALEVFQKAGWLKPTSLGTTIECSACEENCIRPVEFSSVPAGRIAPAYVACEKRSEVGKVKIPQARLQQWQVTHAQIARWVSGALHLGVKPSKDAASASFVLGNVQGNQRLSELRLDLNEPVSLNVSGHMRPLSEISFIADGQPSVDRAVIAAMVDLPPVRVPKTKQSAKMKPSDRDDQGLEVGTPRWREQAARKAANARHSKPGGSRDKRQRILRIWATGKYSSRDRCAEEECGALNMSYSAARRALRNTPDP